MIHSSYFKQAFEERQEIVEKIMEILADKVPVSTSIAFRGMSGAIMAPIIAYERNSNLIIVRKPGESTHSTMTVEGDDSHDYVIVDDFICEGTTVRTIVRKILEWAPHIRCLGVVVYTGSVITEVDVNDPLDDDAQIVPVWCTTPIREDPED